MGDFGPVSASSARRCLSPLCIVVTTEREAMSHVRTGIRTYASVDETAVFIEREKRCKAQADICYLMNVVGVPSIHRASQQVPGNESVDGKSRGGMNRAVTTWQQLRVTCRWF